MDAQSEPKNLDITSEKSWRNLLIVLAIGVGYFILGWLATSIFPGIPCNESLDPGCAPIPTTTLLLVQCCLPVAASALALLKLPMLWQQSRNFGMMTRWAMRLVGLAVWLWLIVSTLAAIVALIGRFTS